MTNNEAKHYTKGFPKATAASKDNTVYQFSKSYKKIIGHRKTSTDMPV